MGKLGKKIYGKKERTEEEAKTKEIKKDTSKRIFGNGIDMNFNDLPDLRSKPVYVDESKKKKDKTEDIKYGKNKTLMILDQMKKKKQTEQEENEEDENKKEIYRIMREFREENPKDTKHMSDKDLYKLIKDNMNEESKKKKEKSKERPVDKSPLNKYKRMRPESDSEES